MTSITPRLIVSTQNSPPLKPVKGWRWYLIHSKPRQENVALEHLTRQGYECYLPQIQVEKVRRRTLEVCQEPLFSRYLFIHLSDALESASWGPIRSTTGVSQLVRFGLTLAHVQPELIEYLKHNEQVRQVASLFESGERVVIEDGAFKGIEAIYQTKDAEQRAILLLHFLNNPVTLSIEHAHIRKC